MKKWSILFAIASLIAVAGCGDDGNDTQTHVCGNGVKETVEQCDDGNTVDGDGCSSACQTESPSTPAAPVCGNGVKETVEQCDDGNTVDGDGCSSACQTESPSTPAAPVCGDGKKEGTEQCDDGNKVDGDGCSAVCELEENQSSDSRVPKVGEPCPEEDDGLSMCGADNKVVECTEGVYELVESCSDKGTDYYCDALVDEEFVACVKSCTAEQEGQVTGYDGCLFGYVNVTQCERGVSGNWGSFGGQGGENVCSPDGTKMVSCVSEESDEIKETPCAGGCTMHWDDDLSEYISECK